MRTAAIAAILLCACVSGLSTSASGAVLGFEEIHGGNTGTYVGFTSYGGLNWGTVLAARVAGVTGSGFQTGIVEGITGAVNTLGPNISVWVPAGETFTFNGAFFTAFANDYQPIDFYGYRAGDDPYGSGPDGIGTPSFLTTIITDTAGATGSFDPPVPSPTYFGINFPDIESMVIHSHDGADSVWGGVDSTNTFIMDLFTYNEPIPEPATILSLMALGATWIARRR